DTRDEIKEKNKQIHEGVFTAMADPKDPYVPPAVEEIPPFINFAPLENALEVLNRSAERYDKAVRTAGGKSLSDETLRSVNQKLIQSERKLTHQSGLPLRPWFKHLIYAPGYYTGYGVKTIPGVREAIEQKRWKEAEGEVLRVALALENEAALIDAASKDLESAGR
ncbi:MAG TPA: transferrin receptor-like dimerization domain-containing protein, partial [Bacteroidota bacterium]|nr:transferrin receptor-like dimerization domain-containing protein [Bacteroidota bacterium]